jgi:hypothetical protein
MMDEATLEKVRAVVTEETRNAINKVLEEAAKAVYDSEYAWDDRDLALLNAAKRVRALKIEPQI